MESFTEKIFELQRKATQSVMQKMGVFETTHDEQFDNTFGNFKRLGEFLGHLEDQTKQSLNSMEKMCINNNALATSLCNFVLSEMSSDDPEFSTGLLNKYFLKTAASSARTSTADIQKEADARKSKFQDSVQRLYDGLGTIGHENMKTALDSIDYQVLNPIKKDQEFNKITKQLIDKKKKVTLDYDSIKKSSEMEKVRLAKEEYEMISKKTASHLQNRSFIRCKLIIHSIVTMIQQFCVFFESNSVLLDGLITFIEPLLSSYQLNDEQLSDLFVLKKPTPTQPTPLNNSNNNNSHSNNNNKFNSSNNSSAGSSPYSPPSYNEHIKSHPIPNNNGIDPNSYGQFPNMSTQSPHSSSYTSSPSTTTSSEDNSPQPVRKQPEPKLFSVWDEDSTSTTTTTTTTTATTTADTNQKSNQTPKKSDDDWMYHSTPKTSTNGSTGINMSNDSNWEDPLIPEKKQASQQPTPSSTPQTPQNTFNNHFRNFNTGSNGMSNNNNSTPNMNNGNYMNQQPKFPQQNQYQNFNQQQQTPQQQTPQQQTPQQQTPQQQKPKSGYENIFGDFDFTPPPNSKNPSHNSSSSNNSNSNSTGSNGFNSTYFMPQQPSVTTTASQHIDDSQYHRQAIEPIISDKIKKWSEKNGRKNNLRILLSTLHEVLWEDAGWEKIGIGAMVAPVQVKKVYRKAIMVVHPDKVHNGTIEQKMIAQRIFESLRESFEVFKVDLEPNSN
ncbi:DNAJ heat shock N-terminal domain-containing protein [Tieghemostelium lacteum]|uniref:DNAJ heat shock N-terminal domain-containing protein n=1 Tax=Tieghemostelium lacteum TaxID=361077 RepID=A0A151Z9Y7_TIELA|nr:DNAJ heat shock N-terminal domain-containing protein [Tieghemostelium lacteum]|eukprot:KYQ90768.1 DNAJ heat shock N-terminal domain-containing protein [Tieghemostelium lacteum]